MIKDGLLLTAGTFTRIPVPAPVLVDGSRLRLSLMLAPLAGLALGTLGGFVLLVADRALGPGLLPSVLALAMLAWLTRGLHWDGAADLADGLGVRGSAADSLRAMRDPRVGVFGVLTVVLLALVQVTALAAATTEGRGLAALVLAQVAGRTAMAAACRSGIPAARGDGLGSQVAGALKPWDVHLLVVGLAVLGAVLLGVTEPVEDTTLGVTLTALTQSLAVLAAAGAATAVVLSIAARRLGGVTGDVLGATCEVVVATCLVVVAALP